VWPSAEPVPKCPSPDLGHKWKAIVEIIFGIVGDGGGLIITPSGKPIPSPPDPRREVSGNKRDILLGLAISELASIASSADSRKNTREAGIEIMKNAINEMKNINSTLSQDKEQQTS